MAKGGGVYNAHHLTEFGPVSRVSQVAGAVAEGTFPLPLGVQLLGVKASALMSDHIHVVTYSRSYALDLVLYVLFGQLFGGEDNRRRVRPVRHV